MTTSSTPLGRPLLAGKLLAAAIVAVGVVGLGATAAAQVHQGPPDWQPHPDDGKLSKATLTQRLDNQVPKDLEFRTSQGDEVELADYFDGDRPIILALGYVQCPNLCTLVHESLVKSLEKVPLQMGEDFQVLSVSIAPDEPLDLTRSARQRYLQMYGRKGASDGWHSLVGHKKAIAALSEAVGFSYAYDKTKDEYSHPAALVVLTPGGKVSKYFYGLRYDPDDLKLGLIDASEGTIGSPVDQILLRCCSYDPSTGKYSLEIMNVLRIAGAFTTVILGAGLLLAFKRNQTPEEPS